MKLAIGACAARPDSTAERCERLGDVQTRVIAADERMGIVWLRMAWVVRERGGDQLTVGEMFKVYDGRIHSVEACGFCRRRNATEDGSNAA